MIRNSKITIYYRTNENNWLKSTYDGWWFRQSNSNISTTGQMSSDTVTVRIERTDLIVQKGDYAVRGEIDKEITTVADLKGLDYFKITGINVNAFGNTPHTKLVGE